MTASCSSPSAASKRRRRKRFQTSSSRNLLLTDVLMAMCNIYVQYTSFFSDSCWPLMSCNLDSHFLSWKRNYQISATLEFGLKWKIAEPDLFLHLLFQFLNCLQLQVFVVVQISLCLGLHRAGWFLILGWMIEICFLHMIIKMEEKMCYNRYPGEQKQWTSLMKRITNFIHWWHECFACKEIPFLCACGLCCLLSFCPCEPSPQPWSVPTLSEAPFVSSAAPFPGITRQENIK